MSIWNERYRGEEYLFGSEPNAFLAGEVARLEPGMRCLAVADGEGRNGVWLAEQGLSVLSVDGSCIAQEKAKALAVSRGVELEFEEVDLLEWCWPEQQFDAVVAIFIQFASATGRDRLFAGIKHALKPGGVLLLQGYTPRQLQYRTGGPSQLENLYTEPMLRACFEDMEILRLTEYEREIAEGKGHSGMSALIDLVARKRL